MRFAMVAPTIGDAFGQERVTRDSCELLRGAGHEIAAIGDKVIGNVPEGWRVKLVPGLSSLHWLNRTTKAREMIDGALAFIRSFKPDLVHFIDQFDYRLMEKVAAEYPTVLTAHTVAPTCPQGARRLGSGDVCAHSSGWHCLLLHHRHDCLAFLKSDLHRAHNMAGFQLKRRALSRFRRVAAISQYMKQVLVADGFPDAKVSVVYNPVSMTPLAPPMTGVPSPVLVCAARLVPLKGIDRLLRALKRIEATPWTLVVCGEGAERENLEALTASLGIAERVRFQGWTSYVDTRRWMAASAIVLQTNSGPEGFGLSIAEASALGIPVIGFDVPALDEIIVAGKTGFLVPAGDEDGLASAIDQLLRDEGLRRRLGQAGKEHVARQFGPERHLAETLRFYELSMA